MHLAETAFDANSLSVITSYENESVGRLMDNILLQLDQPKPELDGWIVENS